MDHLLLFSTLPMLASPTGPLKTAALKSGADTSLGSPLSPYILPGGLRFFYFYCAPQECSSIEFSFPLSLAALFSLTDLNVTTLLLAAKFLFLAQGLPTSSCLLLC